jgi:hypothetical protein
MFSLAADQVCRCVSLFDIRYISCKTTLAWDMIGIRIDG